MNLGINSQQNTVMFVTSQPEVRQYLYELFANPKLPFHKDYQVVGDAPTRNGAITMARERKPTLILFFEKTAGNVSIVETIYQLRLTGARILYFSTQRMIGDFVLEALVSYGVWDLILEETIDSQMLVDFVYNKRDFKDAAIFARKVVVADSGGGKRGFEIPDLDDLRRSSTRLAEDYLTDSVGKAVQGMRSYVQDNTASQSVAGRLFSSNPNQPRPQQPVQQPRPIQQPQPTSGFGVGDLSDLDIRRN